MSTIFELLICTRAVILEVPSQQNKIHCKIPDIALCVKQMWIYYLVIKMLCL